MTRTGGPDVLELREAPDPVPAAGQVCIEVEAAGVNFADLMARFGLYPDAPRLPAVFGYEVAGTVASVGAHVTEWEIGDAVLAMTRFGGYSSKVCLPTGQVFGRPATMTAEEGAALPVNYLTAFQAMVVMGGLRHADELGGRRQKVLVHSASGGVGTAAADLGRIYGAELFGTASPAKHDYVHEHGYAHAIDYRNNNWVTEVMRLSGGTGMDLILDPIGGEYWKKGFDCLTPTGRLVAYGFSSAAGGGKLKALQQMARVPWLRFAPLSLIGANHGVLGVNLGHLWRMGDAVNSWMTQLLKYYQAGQIHPHVDRVFAFEKAGDAHRYIEERKNRGKVLLRP